MNSKIMFVNQELKEEFDKLGEENPQLRKEIIKSLREIQKNAFIGTELRKHSIPKDYQKKGIHNLWKYDIADSWKLYYSVENTGTIIVAIILEWADYKNYENMRARSNKSNLY